MEAARHCTQPGWSEIFTAVLVYVVGVSILGYWMLQLPDDQAVFRINVAGCANGAIGLIALLTAFSLRVRNWSAFGFRSTTETWLIVSIMLGILAFGLIFVVEAIYFSFITEPNTQVDFEAAAQGGILSMLLLLFTSAVLGPIGEELVFRSVVASGLERYGAWVSVVGSAAIFGVIHGPSC